MDYERKEPPFRTLAPGIARQEETSKTDPKPVEKNDNEITFVEYTGTEKVCQVRMPEDLRKSLQMHATRNDMSFSQMLVHFVCASEPCLRAHVSVSSKTVRRPKAA